MDKEKPNLPLKPIHQHYFILFVVGFIVVICLGMTGK
jgi:hypothetical protein